MTEDPYAALGLCRNPFVAEPVAGVADELWVDRGHSEPPAVGQHLFVQLIGEKGAGKSSHLLFWQARTGGPYLYVPLGLARWRLPPIAPIAYWDEANRLPAAVLLLALFRAARRPATIAVGTHNDLSRLARLVGYTVRTIHLLPPDVDTLLLWAERRIAAVRLPAIGSPALRLDRNLAERFLQESDGSWRDLADRLHVWAATEARKMAARPEEGGVA